MPLSAMDGVTISHIAYAEHFEVKQAHAGNRILRNLSREPFTRKQGIRVLHRSRNGKMCATKRMSPDRHGGERRFGENVSPLHDAIE